MSGCVMDNKEPLTPGEEGLRDLTIMMKIYEAARAGNTLKVLELRYEGLLTFQRRGRDADAKRA